MSNTLAPQREDELLSVADASAFLGRSQWWLLAHTTGGEAPKVPFIKFGRRIQFLKSDLLNFVQQFRQS